MSASARAASSIPEPVLDRLKTVVGAVGFIDDPSAMLAYTKSWRGSWVGQTPLVLRPANTQEVAALVSICAETGTPIVPQGGNTGLTYGGQPFRAMSEVVVTTERMRKIRSVDTINDTMTVDAGCILKDIQTAASDADRLFPLSLGAEGSCHIGGNISTNAGGVQVLRYGNMRNLVLGLEVVLPDGRIWNGMRSLRKDNTGYDLKHLFIGAEGTLGIITAAVLRLFPRPREAQSAFIGLATADAGVALLNHMRARLGDAVSSFELIGRPIVDMLLAGVPGHTDPLATPHEWYILMEVTGQGEVGSLYDPLAAALADALDAGLVEDAVIATSGDQAKKLWKMREDFPEAQKSAGGSIAHDVSVPLSSIPEFITRADAAMASAYPDVRRCCFGHVGDGNLHYNPIRPLDWSAERFAAETENINRIVHDIVVSLDGSISAEHGIGRLRLAENVHYKSAVEIEIMSTIKRALDPRNIMNPGKVVPV
jgi:FAD/FMN-containing dehydrogenase